MSSNDRVTRSGRRITKPVRWEPVEDVTDDFGADEYDTDDGSDISSVVSCDSDEGESGDESDDGSDLEDFIVDDDDEQACDENE